MIRQKLQQVRDLEARGEHERARAVVRETTAEYEKELARGFSAALVLEVMRWHSFMGDRERVIELADILEKQLAPGDDFTRNIVLNEREIAEGKLVLRSRPRSFTITLTNRCNLDCIMCEAKRIDWDIPESVLGEITGAFPYLEHVMWQGGEVFLLDGFTGVLREAKKYPRMKQVITSNGMALSKDTIQELAAQPDLTLTLSIDAAERDSFERIRKGASWETLLANIAALNEARRAAGPGMKLNINVTVMRSNYRKLGGILEFAHTHHFDFVFFTTVTGNEGTGENIFVDRDPEALGYLAREMPVIEKKAKEYGIFLHNWLPRPPAGAPANGERRAEKPAEQANRHAGLLCHAPWQRIYIDWKGNFFPDCMCLPDKPAGNVKEATLAELWNGEGMQGYRKKMLEGRYAGLCKKDCVEGRIPPEYLKLNR
jgi:Predicted Fe-S oxidoreductases